MSVPRFTEVFTKTDKYCFGNWVTEPNANLADFIITEPAILSNALAKASFSNGSACFCANIVFRIIFFNASMFLVPPILSMFSGLDKKFFSNDIPSAVFKSYKLS